MLSHLFVKTLIIILLTNCIFISEAFRRIARLSSSVPIHAFVRPRSVLLCKKSEGLDSLKLDETTLSKEELDRLQFIQKLSLEADEMIRSSGLSTDPLDVDSDEQMQSILETQWSGQSDVEVVTTSSKNYDDIISRKGLATGDLLALILFAAVGRGQHGEGLDLIGTVLTALPFLVSWLLVSPYLGAYTREATSSKSNLVIAIAPAWAVSIPFGILIRSILKGSLPPIAFIIVTLGSTLLFISVWRFVFLSLVGVTSDKEEKDAGFLEIFKMVGTLVRRW